jgi:hypothetical protein
MTVGRGAGETWKKIEGIFAPPPELRDVFGDYPSLRTFHDGRPVQTPADWRTHRAEVLAAWHRIMGPWPALLDHPKIELLSSKHEENFTRQAVRVDVAPGRMTDGYLILPDGEGPFPAVLTVYYGPKEAAGLVAKVMGTHSFGYQLSRRGFVTLNIGADPGSYYPDEKTAQLQPLSFLAYIAANGHTALAGRPDVDGGRIGIVGHSFGGKWAMFAACLYEKFAAGAWSDPGIVWDEARPNVNYWEPWYLGHEPGKKKRTAGVPTGENPATGAYVTLRDEGHDLHELQALMAPRPFLVSGGSEDQPERWKPLNRVREVYDLLGAPNRVAMSNRPAHTPTPAAVEQMCLFFEYFLKPAR